MGNKFGNFASAAEAAADLEADGFALNERGLYAKRSMTGGNLWSEPRACTALVEITSYRVDGAYASDGEECRVYQQHFL